MIICWEIGMHLESLKVEMKIRYSQTWQFQLKICRAKRWLFSEEKERTCAGESLLRKAYWEPKGLCCQMKVMIEGTDTSDYYSQRLLPLQPEDVVLYAVV